MEMNYFNSNEIRITEIEFYFFKGKEEEHYFKMLTLFFIGKHESMLHYKFNRNIIIHCNKFIIKFQIWTSNNWQLLRTIYPLLRTWLAVLYFPKVVDKIKMARKPGKINWMAGTVGNGVGLNRRRYQLDYRPDRFSLF